MTLRADGKVGVGVTSPAYKLDVHGSANVGALTATTISGPVSGNASTATALATARTIGGVSFDGTANIDLPGVNTSGNQNTSGNATTATTATNQSGGTVNATTITGTSISLADNITHTGDTDTYMGFSGADTISMGTGGSERMRIDASGNVGIGTNDPKQKLEVHGNMLLGENDVQSFIHSGGDIAVSADTNVLIVADSNDTSGAANNGGIIFGSGSAVNMNQNRDFTYAQAYPSNVPRIEHMRITGDGNVGIGVSPVTPLHVSSTNFVSETAGPASSANTVVRFSSTEVDSTLLFGLSSNASYISSFSKTAFTTEKQLILNANGGNVGIGTNDPRAILHVSSGTTGDCVVRLEADTDNDTETDNARIEFISDGGYNTALVGAGQLPFSNENLNALVLAAYQTIFYTGVQNFTDSTNMLERMRIDVNGNVGIGTAGPLQRLHVKGNGENPIIYMTDPTNPRYASGMGTHHVSNEGQRLDFYTGDSGANDTSLSSSHIRMSINTSGNVGIGTKSPSHKMNIKAASGDAEVHIQAQGNAGDAILYFNGATTNQRKCAIIASNVAPASYCKQDLHFCMDTVSDLGDVTIADSKMVITNAGNVGIGTGSPATKLHVDGSLLVGSRLPYGTNTSHTDAQLILGGAHNDSTDYTTGGQIKLLISGGDNDGSSPYYIMCEDENGQEQFWVKGSESSGGDRSHARINDIGFSAYRSGGGDDSFTGTVVFNNQYYDHGGCYSTSTGKFTAPVAGIYRFGFNSFTNQVGSTTSRVFLYKNEAIFVQKGNTIDRHGSCIDTLVELAVNDTVSIRGSSTYPVYLYKSQGHNIFYGHLVTAL